MRTIYFLSALIPTISAHTRFTTLFVNSQSQGDGTCIRMDMDPSTTTDFISSISSADMACGVQGDLTVNRTCPLKAGDSISLLHRLWTDGSQPGSIDPSHKGSTAVYMKKLAGAESTNPYSTSASGDGWFKIAWNGYDSSSNQWGTEKMIANDGKVEATIPDDLPGGYYLVRSEILSLQNIIDNKVAPQFYAGCAQVYVDGSESGGVNAQTVNVPGYIDDNTPALSYDVYSTMQPPVPYVEFGPPIYGSGSTGSVNARAAEKLSLRHFGHGRYGFGRPSYNNAAAAWEKVPSEDSDGSSDGTVEDSTPSAAVASSIASSTISSGSGGGAASSSLSSTSVASSLQAVPTSVPNTATTSASSIVGTCPSDTILTVANQCLTEIPSWSSDTPGALPKCWAASQQCWDTSSLCWNNLSPAINADDMSIGCHAWESKCNAIVDWCNAGNLEGPPAWSGGNVANGNGKMTKRDRGRLARRAVSGWRKGPKM